jgi:Flp pilus assembly protein CpaB
MWFVPLLVALAGCGSREAEVRSVFVVVAARDLSVGVPIGEQDVYGLQMDVRYVPDDVYLDPTEVLGRVPSAKILANEPIRGKRLANGELQRMVEGLVPRDKQVITAPLDETVAVEPVAGRDLVDVWVVMGDQRARVLEQVTFLRIDHRSVALTLTDPQAAELQNARSAGEVVVVPSGPTGMNFATP